MNFEKIYQLLNSNTTVKLITANNAALVISFLFKSFKQNNLITIPEKELTSILSGHLFAISQIDDKYSRQPKE